jgi:hypothetical protein
MQETILKNGRQYPPRTLYIAMYCSTRIAVNICKIGTIVSPHSTVVLDKGELFWGKGGMGGTADNFGVRGRAP